jgi:hypothetical protein
LTESLVNLAGNLATPKKYMGDVKYLGIPRYYPSGIIWAGANAKTRVGTQIYLGILYLAPNTGLERGVPVHAIVSLDALRLLVETTVSISTTTKDVKNIMPRVFVRGVPLINTNLIAGGSVPITKKSQWSHASRSRL